MEIIVIKLFKYVYLKSNTESILKTASKYIISYYAEKIFRLTNVYSGVPD